MPVYIHEKDALERMAQIEGARWKDEQNGDPEGPYSFNGFLRAWQEWAAYSDEDDEPCNLMVDDNDAIYGADGWHRYAVQSDGEIIFLCPFASNRQHVDKAEKLGFALQGDWRKRSDNGLE